VVGSSIPPCYSHARMHILMLGPEIGVASTKAFITAQRFSVLANDGP